MLSEETKDKVLYEVFAMGYHASNPHMPDFLVEQAWNEVKILSASREVDSIELIKARMS